MARSVGARARMALAFESTYGVAPATGFKQMPFASSRLGAEQPLLENELLGYGRDPLAPTMDALTSNGEVVVPIDVEAMGYWLKAAFGPPTSTGTGKKVHSFNSGGWDLPSMAIEIGTPEVPRYAMYTGCKLDKLSWTMQHSGHLTATASLIAQGEAVAGASAAGTVAPITVQRFGQFNGSVKRNGAALGNVVSAEITYANNLDPVETIRADGRIDGADAGMASLTGRMNVRFADDVLVEQAISGAPCELVFGFEIDADTSFVLTAHAVYLPRPRVEISGPGGVQVSFEWQAALASSPTRMCTAVLKNSIANY